MRGYPAEIKTLGDAIRAKRLERRMLQKEVAREIGCDKMTVLNWERNYTQPRILHLAAVVAFLGYDPFLPAIPQGAEAALLTQDSSLGSRLVAYRKARGLRQKDLARALGVDPSTLAEWERGEREPQGRYLDAVLATISGRSGAR